MGVLADIQARKGENVAARESHDLARAIYTDLGMKFSLWLRRVKA
jgi:hypothetical protein